MKNLILVLSAIWLTTGATPLVAQEDTAHFRITVSGSREPIALACEEGCAWKTLTFSLDPNGTLIDEYGMRAPDAGGDARRFVIRVGSAGDRMALTCEKGCAWKALEFALTPVPAVVTELGKVSAVAGPESSGLSPTDIQLAIDLGQDAKAARAFLVQYHIVAYHAATGIGRARETTPFGVFSTPFSRVVIASCEARLAGRPFTPADVTPQMLAPELRVLAFRWNESVSHPIWCYNPRPIQLKSQQRYPNSTPPLQNVTEVVILPSSEKAATPILPARSEKVKSRDLGLPDHIWYGSGVQAVFPLEGLPARPILRLKVFPSYGGRVTEFGRNDGRFPIDLTKLP